MGHDDQPLWSDTIGRLSLSVLAKDEFFDRIIFAIRMIDATVETDDEGRIAQGWVCDPGQLGSQIEKNCEEISVEFWNNESLSDLRHFYFGTVYGDPRN